LDLAPGYQTRTGYRLPTEPEFEYAARAGSETPWHFGRADDELTSYHAWWHGNSHAGGMDRAFPVGLLKPNDWGLFDTHGNASEWCQESATPQEATFAADVDTVVRGGAFLSGYLNVAADKRMVLGRKVVPRPVNYIGFRVVRTMPVSDADR
jgi:formylglycine-generating enzyme required for sulfatase activity